MARVLAAALLLVLGYARARAAPEPDLATVSNELAGAAKEARAALERLPELNKMRAPDSPAFDILDASPSEIQRPTSVSQLALNLGTFLGGGSLIVPKSLSLEVAPYWLRSHPTLTLEALERQRFRKVFRNTTISLGTRSVDASQDVPNPYTDLAAGIRLKLYDGKPSLKCALELQTIKMKAADAATAGLVPADVMVDLSQRFPPQELDAAVEAWKAARVKTIEDMLPRLSEACLAGAAARMGLLVDAAGAAAWRFTTSSFDSGRFNTWAAGITAGWAEPLWSVLVLTRYQRIDIISESEGALDVGARIVFASSRFAISSEGIHREVRGHDPRYRVVALVEYAILPASDAWLSVSFGRDALRTGKGELVALANLKFWFGTKNV